MFSKTLEPDLFFALIDILKDSCKIWIRSSLGMTTKGGGGAIIG